MLRPSLRAFRWPRCGPSTRRPGASQETIQVDPEADLSQLAYVDVVQWVPKHVTGRAMLRIGPGHLRRADGPADRHGVHPHRRGPPGPALAPADHRGPARWPRDGCHCRILGRIGLRPRTPDAVRTVRPGRVRVGLRRGVADHGGRPPGHLAETGGRGSRGASQRTCCSPCSEQFSDKARWCRSTSLPSFWSSGISSVVLVLPVNRLMRWALAGESNRRSLVPAQADSRIW